jgi:hypothetical protein
MAGALHDHGGRSALHRDESGRGEFAPEPCLGCPARRCRYSLFIVLTAHRAEEAVAALSTDSSNHDLEMAFAAALRETLRAARSRIAAERPPETADFDEWFKLWDRRLERGIATPEDASLLFYSDNPPDAVSFSWLKKFALSLPRLRAESRYFLRSTGQFRPGRRRVSDVEITTRQRGLSPKADNCPQAVSEA